MKYHELFEQYLGCSNPHEVFRYLLETITNTITLWDYYVNWDKVFRNIDDLEIDLNTLNYLVGKTNIEDEFRHLLQSRPSVARLIPILLACRDSDFEILTDYASGKLSHKSFKFREKTKLTAQEIEDACQFARETGILHLFRQKRIKSVPDYVIGIEVGLDSNGRKNRGGTNMETIVGEILGRLCDEHQFPLMVQATATEVQRQWGLPMEVDKTGRRLDFAIRNGDILYLIETNFYQSTGSKLKSTAGEYKALYDFIARQGHRFIWITDGRGWRSTVNALEETFYHVDYILNLKMASSGLLAQIIARKL